MSLLPRGRLYISYTGSTSETSALQNVWETFPFPSTSITNYRDSGDISVSDSSGLTFTYSGHSAWYDVTAVCNVYKGTGGNVNRNLEFQWELNGSPIGSVRGVYMNNQDSIILTGTGQLYLNDGDVIKPKIRNIENDDKINIKSCDFIFKEDISWGE